MMNYNLRRLSCLRAAIHIMVTAIAERNDEIEVIGINGLMGVITAR